MTRTALEKKILPKLEECRRELDALGAFGGGAFGLRRGRSTGGGSRRRMSREHLQVRVKAKGEEKKREGEERMFGASPTTSTKQQKAWKKAKSLGVMVVRSVFAV